MQHLARVQNFRRWLDKVQTLIEGGVHAGAVLGISSAVYLPKSSDITELGIVKTTDTKSISWAIWLAAQSHM